MAFQGSSHNGVLNTKDTPPCVHIPPHLPSEAALWKPRTDGIPFSSPGFGRGGVSCHNDEVPPNEADAQPVVHSAPRFEDASG